MITGQESISEFFERIYVNHITDTVLVWETKKMEGIPKRWTIKQVREYLAYLERTPFDLVI